ncbi:MAG TPA: TonB-dependent receptor [Verrucomicrobiae bacterium]|nr:TonB-dependent receptor [Verrucomicrobiae bacterium]
MGSDPKPVSVDYATIVHHALRFVRVLWPVLLCAAALTAQSVSAPEAGGTIRGVIKSGGMPIPGVAVSAANTLTGQKAVSSTDVNGAYFLKVSANGRYVVRAQMAAFAPLTREVLINDASRAVEADFDLILLSRAQEIEQKEEKQAAAAASSSTARGFRSLSLTQSENSDSLNVGSTSDTTSIDTSVAGMSSSGATESVSISGNTSTPFANMSSEEMHQRFEEFRQENGMSGPGFGGPGGFGGGFGGPGGFRGGGPILFGGRRGRFNINRPHGSIYYSVGSDALNAAPYELTGQPTAKPSYLQNKFGASLGGPLNIPKIYHGGTKTFFFFNYNGSRGENPFDAFSTVPTVAERGGDFSSSTNLNNPVQIFNPFTGTAITGNNLQNSGLTISPVAQGLLNYIPLPNLAGASPDTQNFHYVTSANNSSDDLNIRLNHSLGGTPSLPGPGRGRGPRNNLNFGFHYHATNTNLTNPFPSIGGNTNGRSFDIPVGYVRSFGRITNNFHVDFNRARTSTQNLYAFSQNIAGDLGISGISTDPFDWGLPNLAFNDFGSLADTNPQLIRNQTWTFTDNLIWNKGKQTVRWGGDFRWIGINTEASNDARGTFVFNGDNTAQYVNGAPVTGTGFDLADFLLGLPIQTRVQTTEPGANNYHFRGDSWDLFVQEEYRVRGNLSLNLGVRYEYVSPMTELNNRIANLDISPSFLTDPNQNSALSVQLVLPGGSGPYNGVYPASLMHPDRNNFAPRVGIAWKPLPKTVVRAGYGINYNTTAYQSIVQQLAFQPPFATTATNVQVNPGDLTLQSGFPAVNICTTPGEALCQITNTYAVNPNYRLGYVQIWNLNIQQEIRPTLLLNIDYTGTKGTRLDILEAPNRDQAGIRLATVDAFNWQTSVADSHLSAGSIRLRKRLQAGYSVGGTYTFSKSIDDASSIGGGTSVVAQNPFDLAAERGLSVFDQTHKFTGDFLMELPFGHDKRWLSDATPWRAIFGDWQWSGDWTIESGLPFTPRVLGLDALSGTTGTVRPNLVPGQSITVPHPSIHEWFNPAAFAAPVTAEDCNATGNPLGLPCVYGDARRDSIIGPGSLLFDMAITKVFPMQEGRMLEFRASASNVFNRPQYSSIGIDLNSATFGQVTGVGSMRTITLTARFRF